MSPSGGDFPDIVEVVVEIPRGSRNKYEWDETAGVFRLDRVLSSAVHYNFDYGFIGDTRSGDGDHDRRPPADRRADVPRLPRLGTSDRRPRDARREGPGLQGPLRRRRRSRTRQHVERLDQVRPHRLVEIEHFFQTYKLLEDKDDRGRRLADAAEARARARRRPDRLAGGRARPATTARRRRERASRASSSPSPWTSAARAAVTGDRRAGAGREPGRAAASAGSASTACT